MVSAPALEATSPASSASASAVGQRAPFVQASAPVLKVSLPLIEVSTPVECASHCIVSERARLLPLAALLRRRDTFPKTPGCISVRRLSTHDATPVTEAREAATEERVLGIRFFNGTAAAAVDAAVASRGCVVMPASPALLKLNYDDGYRSALQHADLVLPDSALLTKLWRIKTGPTLSKLSGIGYLRCLFETEPLKSGKTALWVVASLTAKQKAVQFLQGRGIPAGDESFHVMERGAPGQDHALLLKIEERRPEHVIIGLRGGGQEELGIYLRDYLLYRPTVHCVGAALGFLTGDEPAISDWAQRRDLGWLSRLASQPRMILPRVGIALALAAMVFRYGAELPPLRTRWTDL
jgi:UDP-N-acetyl-D-mannosaminuronic acid transferase (WecB/TagA/CpsF family)